MSGSENSGGIRWDPVPAPPTRRATNLLVALALAAVVLAIYGKVQYNDFSMDDSVYLLGNPNIRLGLSAEGVGWAFRSTQALNWHPVTWLSHLLDFELFGLTPRGPHLVNAGIHALNAALLFLVLNAATGAAARSLLVAALFGLHPLHVQSVAWISERKDLLAGLFFMLAVGAHVAHARKPGVLRRASVAVWLTLGLMAKPMLVTVPFVLLLIDAWPLGRLSRDSWRRCLVEKVPLLALSVAASLITYVAQAQGGAVKSLDILPFPERLANAAVSYVAYLAKTVWPSTLAVVYPYPSTGLYAKAAAAGLLLAVVTGVAVRIARQRPFVAWGWFLYLGMLVPVIGLVQVGTQPLADRYTYLPLTGIFVAAAFLLPAPSVATRRGRIVAAGAAALVGLLAAISHAQLRHWKNDYALYRHAAAVIEDNWEATGHAGFMAAWHARDREESLRYFRESLRVKPDNFMTHLNMGSALAEWGRLDEAAVHLRTALQLNPGSARVRSALARVLERQGRAGEAARLSREAAGTDQDRRMSPEQFRQWHPGIKKP